MLSACARVSAGGGWCCPETLSLIPRRRQWGERGLCTNGIHWGFFNEAIEKLAEFILEKKKVYVFDRHQILSFLVKLTPSEDTGSVPNISAHINAILFLKKKMGGEELTQY